MEDTLDILDQESWKKIQDTFSASIQAHIYTVNNKGKEIIKSTDFPFFCQMVKSREKGEKLCEVCRENSLNAAEKGKKDTILFSCHAGLLNILVPIRIKGMQIGGIICGSLRCETPKEAIKKLSKEINIETEELLDALDSIKITSQEEISNYSRLLSIFSKTIPELVYQKKISERRIEELGILHKISQTISQMTDLYKTLELIKNTIKKVHYIEDCSILIFSEKNYEKAKEKLEKAIQEEIIKAKTIVKLRNLDKYPHFGVKYCPYELIALPLILNNNVLGCVIFYVFSIDKVAKEDISFLWVLADQISFAVLNAQNLEKIKNKAITDQLTQLYNREFFMNLLEIDIAGSINAKNPLSLALIDIDDFKHYNDKHGHVKGDELIKELAKLISSNASAKEIVGRYGGEEFIIISPDTNSNVALENLEIIRKKIENAPFFGKEDQPMGRITVSAGLVTSLDSSLTPIELIKEADRSLYKAKAEGKNRIKSTVLVKKDLYAVDVQKASNFQKIR